MLVVVVAAAVVVVIVVVVVADVSNIGIFVMAKQVSSLEFLTRGRGITNNTKPNPTW